MILLHLLYWLLFLFILFSDQIGFYHRQGSYSLLGEVFKIQMLETYCPEFSFTKFPFDSLHCSIVFDAVESIHSAMYRVEKYRIDTSAVDTFISQTEIWSLIQDSLTYSSENVTQFETWTISRVVISIGLQRRYQFYIAQLFVPQIGLSILQLCALILPPEIGERPVFSITVVMAFSISLNLIFSQIPRTTEIVYVVVMTIVKLITSICLSIYMLVTCEWANRSVGEKQSIVNRIRTIDKMVAIGICSSFIFIDLGLFLAMAH